MYDVEGLAVELLAFRRIHAAAGPGDQVNYFIIGVIVFVGLLGKGVEKNIISIKGAGAPTHKVGIGQFVSSIFVELHTPLVLI